MHSDSQQFEEIERELRNFKRLLEESIRADSTAVELVGEMESKLEILRNETAELREENDQFSKVLLERLVMIVSFLNDFQKSLQDVFSFQKSKQDVLKTLKDLTEKNSKLESEFRRIQDELTSKDQQLCLGNQAVQILERLLSEEGEPLARQAAQLSQNLKTAERQAVIEDLKAHLQEKELEEGGLIQKLGQKNLELGLLKADLAALEQQETKQTEVVNVVRNERLPPSTNHESGLRDFSNVGQRRDKSRKRKTSNQKKLGEDFLDFYFE